MLASKRKLFFKSKGHECSAEEKSEALTRDAAANSCFGSGFVFVLILHDFYFTQIDEARNKSAQK